LIKDACHQQLRLVPTKKGLGMARRLPGFANAITKGPREPGLLDDEAIE
jgi:hypothetical protein